MLSKAASGVNVVNLWETSPGDFPRGERSKGDDVRAG